LVYYYFASWQKREFGSALTMPFAKRRVRKALKKAPSAAILDAQSVEMADQPGERGFDAGKKVKGRKRHLLVDTLGLILVAVVHSAAIQDREGAKLVIQKARWFGWLRVIFADAAYSGQLVTWVHEFFGRQGTRLSIVSRLGHGFRLLAKRWIVERTFS
jgi:putative transposase